MQKTQLRKEEKIDIKSIFYILTALIAIGTVAAGWGNKILAIMLKSNELENTISIAIDFSLICATCILAYFVIHQIKKMNRLIDSLEGYIEDTAYDIIDKVLNDKISIKLEPVHNRLIDLKFIVENMGQRQEVSNKVIDELKYSISTLNKHIFDMLNNRGN